MDELDLRAEIWAIRMLRTFNAQKQLHNRAAQPTGYPES